MAGLKQDRRVRGRQRQCLANRGSGSHEILLAHRERGREVPVEGIVGDRLAGLGHARAGGLEIVLRLGGAGAVEQGFPTLLGLQPGQGERPVEIERGFARLVGGDPQIAGGGPHPRRPGILFG